MTDEKRDEKYVCDDCWDDGQGPPTRRERRAGDVCDECGADCDVFDKPWAGKWWADLYRDYLRENPEGAEGYSTPEEYALEAAERRFEFIGPHNVDRRDEDDVCDGCGIEGDCDRMTLMYEPGNTRGVLGVFYYFCDECCGPAKAEGYQRL